MAITFVGDGGIPDDGPGLATAVQYGAKPKVVISETGLRHDPNPSGKALSAPGFSGTDLVDPDFTLGDIDSGFSP